MHRSSLRFGARSYGSLGWLALGAGLASAAFTFLDPQRGAARRAMLRDKTASALRRLGRHARGQLLDARLRLRGRAHELRARLREREVDDAVLEDRVRAQIGRVVSHPRALRVAALDGCIEVSGPVLAHEVDALLEGIRSVRGVKAVAQQLDIHDEPGREPALQGEGSRQAG